MRIQLVCLLLVLLSARVLSRNIKRQYKKFINQHINEQMSADSCEDVIRARKIRKINKECKETNTFIQSNIETVKSICVKNGEPNGDMTKSLKRFNIVVCELIKQKTRVTRCHYDGKNLNKKVIIKCVEGFPVHYHGDIGHSEN